MLVTLELNDLSMTPLHKRIITESQNDEKQPIIKIKHMYAHNDSKLQ